MIVASQLSYPSYRAIGSPKPNPSRRDPRSPPLGRSQPTVRTAGDPTIDTRRSESFDVHHLLASIHTWRHRLNEDDECSNERQLETRKSKIRLIAVCLPTIDQFESGTHSVHQRSVGARDLAELSESRARSQISESVEFEKRVTTKEGFDKERQAPGAAKHPVTVPPPAVRSVRSPRRSCRL